MGPCCLAAATAATERDACLASLARAESESTTVRSPLTNAAPMCACADGSVLNLWWTCFTQPQIQSVYSKMTSLTIDVSEGADGEPMKLDCMAINKADRKGTVMQTHRRCLVSVNTFVCSPRLLSLRLAHPQAWLSP